MLRVPIALPTPGMYRCTQPAAIMWAIIVLSALGKYWCAQPLLLGTNNAAIYPVACIGTPRLPPQNTKRKATSYRIFILIR